MNSTVDEIKSRLDIKDIVEGYLKLEKTGMNYRAVCPFHNEKSPSLFISPSKQIFKCFGCGESGDIFKFIMLIEGVEFPEALKILAAKAGVEIQRTEFKKDSFRQKILDINQSAVKFFQKQLESQNGQKAKEYLLSRGISEQSLDEWEIGYAPNKWDTLKNFFNEKGIKDTEIEKSGLILKGNKGFYDRFRGRIIFPIWDVNSQPIAFGGRIFEEVTGEDGAKYLNIPNTEVYDKSRILYGIDKAKQQARQNDYFILVEGYTDAIMAHQAGCKNTVATCGTALTEYHLSLLGRYTKNLKLCFDMDFAGESATKRGINLALSKGFDLKIVRLPHGKDSAELINQNKEEWIQAVKDAVSIMDFYFQSSLEKFDKDSVDGKKKISEIILPVIKKISNNIEQGFWIQKLASELKMDEKYIYDELKKVEVENTVGFGAEKEESKKEKKDKQQILEQELLKILIADIKLLDKIEEDFIKSLSSSCMDFIDKLKEVKSEDKDLMDIEFLKTKFSEDDINKINSLILEFEVESQGYFGEKGVENLEKELENIINGISIQSFKERLKGLLDEIKIAEQSGNKEKAEQLLKDFNELREKIEKLNQ